VIENPPGSPPGAMGPRVPARRELADRRARAPGGQPQGRHYRDRRDLALEPDDLADKRQGVRVHPGAAPPTVRVLRGLEVFASAPPQGLSAYESNAGELLRATLFVGDLPPRLVVVEIEPKNLGIGVGLSQTVAGRPPDAAPAAPEALEGMVGAVWSARAGQTSRRGSPCHDDPRAVRGTEDRRPSPATGEP